MDFVDQIQMLAEWEQLKKNIFDFDLSSVEALLRSDETNEYEEEFITIAMVEFRRFMILKALVKDLDGSKVIPSPVIRKMWEATIDFPQRYVDFCVAILGVEEFQHNTEVFNLDPNDEYNNDEHYEAIEATTELYKLIFRTDCPEEFWSYPASLTVSNVPTVIRSSTRQVKAPVNFAEEQYQSALLTSSHSSSNSSSNKRLRSENGPNNFTNANMQKISAANQRAKTPSYRRVTTSTNSSQDRSTTDEENDDEPQESNSLARLINADSNDDDNDSDKEIDSHFVDTKPTTSSLHDLQKDIVKSVLKELPRYLFEAIEFKYMAQAFGHYLGKQWKRTKGTIYIKVDKYVPIGVVQLRTFDKVTVSTNNAVKGDNEMVAKSFLSIDWMFGNPPIEKHEEQKAIFIMCLNRIMAGALQREEVAGLYIISAVCTNENRCCVAVKNIYDQIGMKEYGEPFCLKNRPGKFVRYIREK